jgi:hypothetical protein
LHNARYPVDMRAKQDTIGLAGPKGPQPEPLHDPPDPPLKDPPARLPHDPEGDPTHEPEQPFGDPTPSPGGDPPVHDPPQGAAIPG